MHGSAKIYIYLRPTSFLEKIIFECSETGNIQLNMHLIRQIFDQMAG
jgi:hypothetical protein